MLRTTRDGQGRLVSNIATVMLLAVGLALIFCQLAFFPMLGNVPGFSFHSFLYVLPFVGAACCLSLPAYLGSAAVLGVILSLRVQAVPLDFYELHFSHPIGALMSSVFFAAIVWLAVRGAQRVTGRETWAQRPLKQRAMALTVALLAASFVISAVWMGYLYAVYAAYGYASLVEMMVGRFGAAPFWGQVVFDWVVWSVVAIGSDAVVTRLSSGQADRSLHAVFRRWLLLVVMGAFLLTTTVSYVFSTRQAVAEAQDMLTSQVDYLIGQLTERVEHAEPVDNLASSYSFGSSGAVIVFEGADVVSANDERYLGRTFWDIVGIEPTSLEELYQSQELYEDDIQFLQDFETLGIQYFKAARYDNYIVFVRVTAEDVFAHRTATIALNALCYLVLFGAVYVLISKLLDHMVVRGFVRTNEVLARITDGDLEQHVEEHETVEFDALSDGINTTVDALKDLIAEVERRMERDLETGRAIQHGALPQTFPAFPEIDAFDLYASMDAAKEVGGDFYGFFLVNERTLGFLIADVSGKGIPGALFMMTAKTQIERFMNAGLTLAEAVRNANIQLCQGNDAGMFVTLWAATLDWQTGELTYVNAGHNFPLLRHGQGGQWEWIKKKCGLFLGTFETAKYRQQTIMLEPGDELVLYTDGVNEAFSASDEEYGNERLEGFLAAHNELGPRALVEALRADVADWAEGAEQSDDITILALEYRGSV